VAHTTLLYCRADSGQFNEDNVAKRRLREVRHGDDANTRLVIKDDKLVILGILLG
jgi:hypothetical protein